MSNQGIKHITYSNPSTLIELLQRQADHHPGKIAFRSLDKQFHTSSICYRDLNWKARMVATSLQTFISPGERILLLYPPGIDFVVAFFGCLFAGAISVPFHYPIAHNLEPSLPLLEYIINDSDPALILTDNKTMSLADFVFFNSNNLRSLQWYATDSDGIVPIIGWKAPIVDSNDLALLQYTSGSTKEPRGVKISHKNLLSSTKALAELFSAQMHQKSLNWMSPTGEMGIIESVFLPVYSGMESILLSPEAVNQDPVFWLRAISRFEVNICGGPRHAYEICVRHFNHEAHPNLNLSQWDVAYIGSEIIGIETIDAFTRTFQKYGFRNTSFYPCYHLTEASFFVSGSRYNEEAGFINLDLRNLEEGKILVSDGLKIEACKIGSLENDNENLDIKIVDPDINKILEDDEIGEIWISGDRIAHGYWQKPILEKIIFDAKIDGANNSLFLRTGDLGFKHRDGIYLIDRKDEMISINGRKFFSGQIEKALSNFDNRIQPGGVSFFFFEHLSKQLVVVICELGVRDVDQRSYTPGDYVEIVTKIETQVENKFNVILDEIILLEPGTMPRTLNGKINRSGCKEAYLAGSLKKRFSRK